MSRFRVASLAFSAFLLVMLASSGAWAQFTSGLEGTVYDPSGAVVPGAGVRLKQISTGTEFNTKTTSAGLYRFTTVPAGEFALTVTASGFETATQTAIAIQVAEIRHLNVTLKLGTAATQVTVEAQVTPVSVSEASISGQVNETKVHELPLTGRNMYSLVVLTPGITGLPSGGGQAYAQATADIFNAELGANINANGQRAESNNFVVDGANVNGAPRGGVTNLTPNADSIQEIRVQTNTFSAEYGRNSAAIVNVVTKSGSNRIHGSLFEFHTDNGLNSRNIFQDRNPIFRRNEFGYSVGGPFKKDRTFWFTSMDILRSGVGLGFPTQIPTPELTNFLQTNFPNNISTGILTDFPTTFKPTRDFATAGSTLDPDGAVCATPTTLISTPIGNLPCNFPVKGTGDFNTTVPRNGVQWNIKVDHNWNDFKDRIYGSFSRTTRQTVLFASPSVYFPNFSPTQPEYTSLANFNWTHSIGAGFVNQMTLAYTRTFGDAPCDNCQVPQLSSNDGTQLPGNGFSGLFIQNNWEWKDVASLVRGSHTFKFGANAARHHDDEFFTDTTLRPTFSFFNVLDFAADNPFSEGNVQFDPRTGKAATVNVDFATRTWDLGAFFQDDFRLRPNLTLNFGVRWDTFTAPTERFGRQNNLEFQGGDTFQERIANLKLVNVNQPFRTDSANISPRLGFAWDPKGNGKMSVRGGFGLFYDRPSNQLYTDNRNNLPLIANTTLSIFNPPALPVFGLGSSGETPFGFPQSTNIAFGLDEKNGLLNARAGQVIVDPDLQAQFSENWSFGIQYEVARNWVAEVNYLGSVGKHLYSKFNVNRFSGDLISDNVLDRVNQSFGNLTFVQSNFNSWYHGGTAAIRNRGFTKGINFQAAYTYGRAIDQGSSFDSNGVIDIFNLDAEKGLADFDIRHRFSFSTLWQLPTLQTNSRILSHLLNGWQVGNITIFQSGSPFTVFCSQSFQAVRDVNGNIVGNSGCDFNGDGVNNERPFVPTFGNAFPEQPDKQQFLGGVFSCQAALCSDVFGLPGLGQSGNLGRNTFTGPGFANTDFSVIKKTKIPWPFTNEGANLEIRGEFFNVFNRVNLTNVDGNLASGQFGQVTSTFGSRNIQFGLRIEF